MMSQESPSPSASTHRPRWLTNPTGMNKTRIQPSNHKNIEVSSRGSVMVTSLSSHQAPEAAATTRSALTTTTGDNPALSSAASVSESSTSYMTARNRFSTAGSSTDVENFHEKKKHTSKKRNGKKFWSFLSLSRLTRGPTAGRMANQIHPKQHSTQPAQQQQQQQQPEVFTANPVESFDSNDHDDHDSSAMDGIFMVEHDSPQQPQGDTDTDNNNGSNNNNNQEEPEEVSASFSDSSDSSEEEALPPDEPISEEFNEPARVVPLTLEETLLARARQLLPSHHHPVRGFFPHHGESHDEHMTAHVPKMVPCSDDSEGGSYDDNDERFTNDNDIRTTSTRTIHSFYDTTSESNLMMMSRYVLFPSVSGRTKNPRGRRGWKSYLFSVLVGCVTVLVFITYVAILVL